MCVGGGAVTDLDTSPEGVTSPDGKCPEETETIKLANNYSELISAVS